MIPEPCPSRGAQLPQMLVSATLSTGRRAQTHPSNAPATHCHFLLFANGFHYQIKRQKTAPKIPVRPSPSLNFLPPSFFYPYWRPPFPTACGFCYHGDQLGSAEPERNFQGIARLVQRSRCDGSIPGVSPPHSRCDRSIPGCPLRIPGGTGASRGCHSGECHLLPQNATLRGDTGACRDT